jgi:hypothetical protein
MDRKVLVIRSHYLPSPDAPSPSHSSSLSCDSSTLKEITDVDVQHVTHAFDVRHVIVRLSAKLGVAFVDCRGLSLLQSCAVLAV